MKEFGSQKHIIDKMTVMRTWTIFLDCVRGYSSTCAVIVHTQADQHLYTPGKLCLWEGILFSRCPSVHPSVRPSAETVVYIGGYKFGQLDTEVFIFVSK